MFTIHEYWTEIVLQLKTTRPLCDFGFSGWELSLEAIYTLKHLYSPALNTVRAQSGCAGAKMIPSCTHVALNFRLCALLSINLQCWWFTQWLYNMTIVLNIGKGTFQPLEKTTLKHHGNHKPEQQQHTDFCHHNRSTWHRTQWQQWYTACTVSM